jgi:S1-C subfamily serine protease
MNARLHLIALAAGLLATGSHADELADKGRDIFNKNEHAVVTVQAVIKTTNPANTRSTGPTESKQELTGTVIDPSGLTVLALSSVDPAEFYHRLSDDVKMETQVNDLKILLDDGTEIPAEVVLRDQDLDLAFIRPKSKLSTPMAAVDLSKATPAKMLEPVIALNRLNRAAGRAYAASIERIVAVIQKPRTFYIPGSTSSSASLGSPAFALDGNVVGVFVMRGVGGGDTASRNSMRENMSVILVPAADILKGAKQALEAKGDTEKPAEKPALAPATTATNTATGK